MDPNEDLHEMSNKELYGLPRSTYIKSVEIMLHGQASHVSPGPTHRKRSTSGPRHTSSHRRPIVKRKLIP